MGRPRVRNRILQAASDLLATEGLTGLTTRAVAMHAGVTEASLFNNFGDKTGLLQALISEVLPEQTTLVKQISEEIKAVDVWLLSVFEAATAYFTRVLPIAASSLTGNQVSLSRDQAKGFYTPRQMLTDRFRELQENGRIASNTTPELTAIMLMGTAMHTAMTQLTIGDSDIESNLTGEQLALSLALISE